MVAAVKISQVDKSFGNLDALLGIDFEIPRGSFFGLLGPNGAGKSTLINIMAGLVRASSGSVSIMGYDVRRNWRQARQSLGVVPQELVVDPFLLLVKCCVCRLVILVVSHLLGLRSCWIS